MSVASKYDLGPVLIKVMTDPAAAISELNGYAVSIRDKVTAIENATTTTDGEKVNPLEAKYGKDEAGSKAAIAFLTADNGPFDSIVNYIDEDAGRTFHVLNAVSDLLVKYLRTEAEYHKLREGSGRSVKASEKGTLKSDFNEIRELIRNVVGMAQAAGFDPSTLKCVEIDSAGKYKSTLPGYRGTKTSEDGSVTGRYAKVYSLSWVIDGEAVESGWTIPSLVRELWHGSERIGKNAKSLTDILDTKTKWDDPKFTTANFVVNGHKVTVSRTVED